MTKGDDWKDACNTGEMNLVRILRPLYNYRDTRWNGVWKMGLSVKNGQRDKKKIKINGKVAWIIVTKFAYAVLHKKSECCTFYHKTYKSDLTQNTTATATRTPQNKGLMSKTIDVHMHYNSWYISLPSSAKQQREMTKFSVVWRTWPQPLIFPISVWNWTHSWHTQQGQVLIPTDTLDSSN